jgi:hypothetical protein
MKIIQMSYYKQTRTDTTLDISFQGLQVHRQRFHCQLYSQYVLNLPEVISSNMWEVKGEGLTISAMSFCGGDQISV